MRPTTPQHRQQPERLHLRARVLPDGAEHDLWIDEGRLSWTPVDGARTVASGGWVLPALVDAHVHLGVTEVGGPLDADALDADLAALGRAGIGAARVLGSPEPLRPQDLERSGAPLLRTAGVPVAAEERFIPGWGRRASGPELPRACAEEARFGWGKLIADWFDETGGYGPAFAQDEIVAAVEAVHAAGARMAVHAQSADGGRWAVEAGADSIEHGMHLPFSALPELAARGGILVPTGTVFADQAPGMADPQIPSEIRDWYETGLERHPELVRRAQEQGVTVLAGTDLPVGKLVDEIVFLRDAGMSAHDALGAASWTSRRALGLPCLADGERADLIWFEHDPRDDLASLRSPGLAILDGQELA